MTERIDNRLLYEILKGLQARVSFLEAMLGEIRDGFASVRSLRASLEGETVELERRLDELEKGMRQVKHRLQLPAPRDRP